MLQALSIRDIVLIEQLDIELHAGLSVLTGETGAGKSILLDALSLALGARGDGGLVRKGCEQGQVRAVFEFPPTESQSNKRLFDLLKEQDIENEGQLILRRVQNADGRTRASINDQPVSVSILKSVGHLIVEIHGQHDDRALVDMNAHRDLLTSYGGLGRQAEKLAKSWRDMRNAARELKTLKAKVEEAEREADYLRDSAAELTELAPLAGEEEELAGRRAGMMAAEKIATELNEAHDNLAGQASPSPSIASIIRRLERKAEIMPNHVPKIIAHLDGALRELDDAQAILQDALRETEFSPEELEDAEERLFALRAAGRKFSVAVENLPELALKMAGDLAQIDAGAEDLAALEVKLNALRAEYDSLASKLAIDRQRAADALCKAVMAELPDLKLGEARFLVESSNDPENRTEDGTDIAEFYVQTNPGTNPGPLMKVASGGELSRFLLALKVALADKGSAPTLVFDEIDTGVGGAVADAIGARLAKLSHKVQVLSVTHAPQVAARATQHLLIAKSGQETNVRGTRVSLMDTEQRREEIARMLSGAEISEEARAAADRLLAS